MAKLRLVYAIFTLNDPFRNVALLQSAGAAGIGTATSVTLGATGAAMGGGLTGLLTRDKNTNPDTETKTSDDDGVSGFTGVGVAAGSLAGSMKSSTAVIANGGAVAAGSLVALLQSAGAATSATLGATGAALGGKLKGLLTGPDNESDPDKEAKTSDRDRN
ncbi:hypothetical protein Pcinc_004015 [Petrolisthes cinctipes]|uniref:Uncharacterized protein n=1 Tax=Petrolisthes cinctipes TaxID=88211 RepID=A0AAE1GHK6_PETCI|nr:hypothetical protein Pcinc_004015 [Petrolisthes cinctipes]